MSGGPGFRYPPAAGSIPAHRIPNDKRSGWLCPDQIEGLLPVIGLVKRMDNSEQLQLSYGAMVKSRNAVFNAAERALCCQEVLKKAEAAVINSHDPKELGGNEVARSAKIRELTAPERADLENAESTKRAAALQYEIDCMVVDCLKWQIRVEMVARGMVI